MINLHAIMWFSRANGPGIRTSIWFQGCRLDCPNCFNPETHSFEPELLISESELAARIAARCHQIEGITISGGEPMEQAERLCQLLSLIRSQSRLSVLLFSGYRRSEILKLPPGPKILSMVDVLIDGRYEASLHLAQGLRGSSNQQIHLLTNRYSLSDIEQTPQAEIHLDPLGNMVISGVNPPRQQT